MPLVINSLGSRDKYTHARTHARTHAHTHTHTRTDFPDKSNFRNQACASQMPAHWHVPNLKVMITIMGAYLGGFPYHSHNAIGLTYNNNHSLVISNLFQNSANTANLLYIFIGEANDTVYCKSFEVEKFHSSNIKL